MVLLIHGAGATPGEPGKEGGCRPGQKAAGSSEWDEWQVAAEAVIEQGEGGEEPVEETGPGGADGELAAVADDGSQAAGERLPGPWRVENGDTVSPGVEVEILILA